MSLIWKMDQYRRTSSVEPPYTPPYVVAAHYGVSVVGDRVSLYFLKTPRRLAITPTAGGVCTEYSIERIEEAPDRKVYSLLSDDYKVATLTVSTDESIDDMIQYARWVDEERRTS